MSNPYIGEIRTFSFAFAPKGWAMCNGATLAIAQNQALFALLGTTYGGNGQTTFLLPNLQGRTPVHVGTSPDGLSSNTLGQIGGAETVTLSLATMAAHIHSVNALTAPGNVPLPTNNIPASVGVAPTVGASVSIYAPTSAGPEVILANDTVSFFGGGAGHNNLQPSLVLNFCIALVGVFPSRN